MKEINHPSGIKLSFNPKRHTYKWGDRKFVGVTTFIEKFFQKFEAEKIAKKYASKRGLDYKEVMKGWKENGDRSREHGLKIHKLIEDYIVKPQDEYNEEEKEILEKIERDILSEINPVAIEQMVYSPKYEIAGTIDFLGEDKFGNIVIVDWKTNKKIEKDPSFVKYGFDPLNKVVDCNFNHYSLQLNLYRKILIEENYFPDKDIIMKIVHIKDNNIKSYNVDNMEELVEKMLAKKIEI